jgi:MtN3 and saliva related transmembrane protein
METEVTQAIGYIAAACTTFAFIPQVIRVWRTRSAEDISLAMYLILIAGVLMWIVYGTRIHSMPLVAANGVSLVLAGAVLVGKLKFKRARA